MTASIAGLVAYPQDAFYGASKHAVVGFAKALGGALDSRRVRVTSASRSGPSASGRSSTRAIDAGTTAAMGTDRSPSTNIRVR